MANYTPNYNLGKPEPTDQFGYDSFLPLFNDNMDKIDQIGGNQNIAENYDDTLIYAVGDYVIYNGLLYKCDTAVATAETFDPTKWTHVVVTDEMGGGGDVADVTVNGTSVVDPVTKIAEVEVPTKVSELTNDSGYTTNVGTVTSVTGGTGLNGGTINSSGTLSVKYGNTAGTACEGDDARLSDNRLPKETYLTNEDLNDIITAGFYHASSSNSSANKPNSDITAFGMLVIHDAYNTYYCTQILYDAINQISYKRYLNGGTNWTSWVEEDNIEFFKSGYVKTHPENADRIIIPFINNDIAHLLRRGGSAVIKYDDVEQTGVNITTWFNGSPNYWALNLSTTPVSEVVAELTLHQTFTYSNLIYIDFGAVSWRARNVKIEVKNTNYPDDVWTQKYANTDLTTSYCYIRFSHVPVGASGAGGGFNSIRLTFSSFENGTYFRIAQVGVINYSSDGINNVSLSRAGGTVFGSITPETNQGANLGSATNYWQTVYANRVNCNSAGISGDLTIEKTSPYATNTSSNIVLRAIDSTNSITSTAMIRAYQAGNSGANMVIQANGNLFIGGGEGAFHHQALYNHNTSEQTFITSDSNIHIQANANTIANRLGVTITNYGSVLPEVADVTTDNSGSIGTPSYRWANGHFVKLNGVEVGNSPMFTDTNVFYGTCSTGASTAEKVITLVDDTNFSLRAGVSIVVKFSATNTAQNPSLNVNGTGAKSVWYNTALVTTSSLNASGQANRPIQYVYDGTQWIFMGWSLDSNTTYSAMSTSELTTGTATTSRSVRADYLNAGIKSIIADALTWVHIQTVELANVNDSVDVTIPTTAKEVYVEYGNKNGNQIYAGSTMTIMNDGVNSHPCFVPVYNVGDVVKVLYIYYKNTGGNHVVNIKLRTKTDSYSAMVAVYYR